MDNTLLPCPFCGGEAELHDGVVIIPVIDENGAYIDADVEDTPVWVECAACGAATLDGVDSADEAIAAWNRRTDHIRDTTEKVSNADRIRAMSDEELAEYIFSLGNGPEDCDGHCAYQDDCNAEGFNYGTCIKARIKGVTDWLRQPVKEELT